MVLAAASASVLIVASAAGDDSDLLKARDHQDRAALEKLAAECARRGRQTAERCGGAVSPGAGGILFG